MNRHATLDARCQHAGIERGYHDIAGRWREVSDDIRIALLEAAGEWPDAARDATDAPPEPSLPPVLVVRRGAGAVRIPLRLPDADSAAPTWRLELEDGTVLTGDLVPALADAPPARSTGTATLAAIVLPEELPLGYHAVQLIAATAMATATASATATATATATASAPEAPGSLATTHLVVCPPRCFEPAFAAAGARLFGLAVQLYAIRSRRNWGIGDFTDLADIVELSAASGAGLVGLNPLHALFPHQPEAASPYSPSSRIALNLLYLDVEAIEEFDECAAARERVASEPFRNRLDALRRAEAVDYAGVAAAKFEVLHLLWRHFATAHVQAHSVRGRAFERFRRQADPELAGHALFDALQWHFQAQDAGTWGWPAWPAPYQDRHSPEVARFARDHADTVRFFFWLQWLADAQLADVQARARALGMPVGLYRDLAVGVGSGGSETWLRPEMFALGVRVGAPPDAFNQLGQDWGLPPEVPARMRADGYRAFANLIRQNMRHAGALRIDHVMGLMRRFWVPPGRGAADGTYVQYPFDDLSGIVALESHRAECIVIGEDLGVVPEAIRAAMREMRMLSYRPLYFEQREDGAFRAPHEFPPMALSVASTHDLPTLRGFWRGTDIEVRQALGLFPDDETRARSIVERARDRAQLLVALEREGLLPVGRSADPLGMPNIDPPFVQAVHRYLARTPTLLTMIQPDDVFEHLEQVNIPGTDERTHPNWRRRLEEPLEAWAADPRYRALLEAVVTERGRAPRIAQDGAAIESDGGTPTGSTPTGGPRTALIPRATYRLQLHRGFGFADATRIVPYLSALGVSHVYASPFLKARPGSTHGYDIVDHNALNPELGTPQDYADYATALRTHGLAQLVDIVPNHMGVLESDNTWWLDVLENGRASPFAGHFDIDWEPANPMLHDKVLVPVLGEQYGTVLDRGELQLDFDAAAGEFSLRYHRHRFPIDPAEYPRILAESCQRLATTPGVGASDEAELQSLVAAFGHLPGRSETDSARVAERMRDKAIHKRRLAQLAADAPPVGLTLAVTVTALNGTPGEAESYEALHALIEAQAYRLAFWRVAADDINYRRFFDINDLAALRMDSQQVFEDTHRLIFQLIDEGSVQGLRIDHPDGLRDPRGYFERLQRHCGGPAWLLDPSGADKPFYIVVEKILAEHERLPEDWPVHGTTGYTFANLVNGLFVDPEARVRFDRLYRAFVGEPSDYGELLYRAKKLIMRTSLSSEMTALVTVLHRIAGADRHTRDFTANSLRAALTEIVAHFPAYRTYLVPGEAPSAADRASVAQAVAAARQRSHEAEASAIAFIAHTLLDAAHATDDPQLRGRIDGFIGRFQQYCAPVTAKAMEDTTFYRYNRLVSLNEVGGEPTRFGISVQDFHEAAHFRARHWPHAMLATSTHDTKRGEDARARLDVLSEMPAAWRLALRRWRSLNAPHRQVIDGASMPSANDEYLAYQALLAIWPMQAPDAAMLASLAERLSAYMLKAAREAKQHTSWINPVPEYEAALQAFAAGLLQGGPDDPFLRDFARFAHGLAAHGISNSLAQTVIKLTAPGVPDLYQGSELWHLTLVDPDNRRPVDHDLRSRWLDALRHAEDAGPGAWGQTASALFASAHDGRIKLWAIRRLLAVRTQSPGLFERGRYVPIDATGERAAHGVAFARVHGAQALVVVATRLPARLAQASQAAPSPDAQSSKSTWGTTRLELPARLPPGTYTNILTGARFEAGSLRADRHWLLSQVLDVLPVAALVKGPEPSAGRASMKDGPAGTERTIEQMVARDVAARGVDDPNVLAAMRRVPREAFVAPGYEALAYEDSPLPIGEGQTISQPYIVALMLQSVGLRPGQRALEIGAGSGYAAAVMGQIADRVHAIERHPALAARARERLQRLGYDNVEIRVGDGTQGWAEAAPFDAIVVSAGAESIPQALLAQLAPNGRLVMPVGASGRVQTLVRVRRTGSDQYEQDELAAVSFVPLVGGSAESDSDRGLGSDGESGDKPR